MEIRYLGTAAAEGWPAVFCRCDVCKQARALGGKDIRTRSQAVIDETLLVDWPPDSYMHMVQHGLNLPEIQHIIVTHSHQDHFYPLDFVLRYGIYAHDTPGLLHIYGNDAVGRLLEEAITPEQRDYSDVLAFHHVLPYQPFTAAGYMVTPLPATHKVGEMCYVYIIEKDGSRVLYANDTGLLLEETLDWLRGQKPFSLVSMDCTDGLLRDGGYHMGIEDNYEMMAQLAAAGMCDGATQYVATHFSHNGGLLHHQLEETLAPHGVQVAYDGFRLKV